MTLGQRGILRAHAQVYSQPGVTAVSHTSWYSPGSRKRQEKGRFQRCATRTRARRHCNLSCQAAPIEIPRFEVLPATKSAELRAVANLRAPTADMVDILDFAASQNPNILMAGLTVVNRILTEYWDKPGDPQLALKAELGYDVLKERYAEQEEKKRWTCFIAATPDLPTNALALAIRQQMDLSRNSFVERSSPPRIVIGSLELKRVEPSTDHPSVELDGEHQTGRLPESEAAANWARAYLSGVCVEELARRIGVASALIAAASRHASQVGVRHLYVECNRTNQAALSLFRNCGFEIEQEDEEDSARARKRPQRVLFHKSVLDADLLASDP